MNSGWDSFTWRLRPGQQVPHIFVSVKPEFRIGRTFSADSAWLIYRARNLAAGGHAINLSNGPEWDSLIVTSNWTPFTTVGIYDAQMWFRMRLVNPWPEPARKPAKTTTLRGKVVDDSTGCAVFFCQVVVAGTQLVTRSDTLGHFVLNDVPAGSVGLDACAAAPQAHCLGPRLVRCSGSRRAPATSRTPTSSAFSAACMP